VTRSISMEIPEEIAERVGAMVERALCGPHEWTEMEMRRLAGMWSDGLPCSQIAKALGPHMTRNMVIGKAHRLGLPARPSPIKRSEREANGRVG